ncbi:MAG: hypothetical protein JNJ71_12915 [Rubrivivax sp.]|nr:hypothetical protein [Rubrivivax sp.]
MQAVRPRGVFNDMVFEAGIKAGRLWLIEGASIRGCGLAAHPAGAG